MRHTSSDGHSRTDIDRRTVLKAIPLAGLVAIGSGTAGARPTYPDLLPLPDGFEPEGIVTGRGHEFFVGSLATGAIYRGDLRTGAGEVLPESPDDRTAVGLSYDSRSDRLFVAGGATGEAYVYDAKTGATVEVYDLGGGFVNDVVVTRTAAYVTDSARPVLYRLPLGPRGRIPDPSDVEEVQLGGDFVFVAGEFNANGIDAPPDGEYLLVVNTFTGSLYRVDPATGDATEVDLGGDSVSFGDGILLEGKTLYVVRNFLNEIAVVELDPNATAGEVVRGITDPDFDVPTTVAAFGNALYAVNARFNNVPDPSTASYDVVRVPKR